jgi:hypothetical protein
VIENTKNIKELQEVKLDKIVFQKEFEKMSEDVKVIRMATGDLFNTGQATDNYIEKYLPFKLQNLIS